MHISSQQKIIDLRQNRTTQKNFDKKVVATTKEAAKKPKSDYPKNKSNSSSLSPATEIDRDIRRDILDDVNQNESTGLKRNRSNSVNSVESEASGGRKKRSNNDEIVEDSGDIDFGAITSTKKPRSEDVGKPGSKVRRLKRMLQEAEKKKQRLEELKKQGDDGVKRAHAEQWTDIVKEVSGDKVFHDPSKLKKALKRKEKTKSKSAGEWKERLDKLSLSKTAKLEKREANIQQRHNRNVLPTEEKDDMKKKKDGKFPIRAGFEGKKVGFLNKKQQSHKPGSS